jgi:GR25 family glycosyltransferase involved in LPS biosynthesis
MHQGVITILAFLIGFLLAFILVKDNNSFGSNIEQIYQERIDILRQNEKTPQDFKTFPKYYINLDRSEERKRVIEAEAKRYKIENMTRVKAFDGRQMIDISEGNIDNYHYQANKKKGDNINQLAITMSHIKAMLSVKEDMAMIMEDDVSFTLTPYWKKNMQDIINDIPDDCEIFLLSNHRSEKVDRIMVEKCTDFSDFNGVCYIITKKGLEKAKRMFYPKENFLNLTSLTSDYVFDRGCLGQFKVYTYNITLFLLENFHKDSTHDDNQFERRVTTKVTKKVLDLNTFIPLNNSH